MNIVVDTSVLISGILWTGTPSDALKIVLNKYTLVQSYATLIESLRVVFPAACGEFVIPAEAGIQRN